jgi:thiamine-phosphate pyrophosphorylase
VTEAATGNPAGTPTGTTAEMLAELRADRHRRLRAARLYLCTDARQRQGDLPEFLAAALRGGVDIVQLRQKGLEARQELAYAELFADAAARHGALWSVNDRADLALAADADALHLGQDDLPVAVARQVIGPAPLVGLSSHDPDQVAGAATAAGVDYFCVGPCWPTPTKPGRPAPGLPLVRQAARIAPPSDPGGRPWFAIGGIDLARLDGVLAAGARRVVVVRAITEASDPQAAAAALRARLVSTP